VYKYFRPSSGFLRRLLQPVDDRLKYSKTFKIGTHVTDAMEEYKTKGHCILVISMFIDLLEITKIDIISK